MSAADDTGSLYEEIESRSPSAAEATQRPAVEVSEPLQPHNCVLCQQRKVKCDRLIPCTPCKRSRVECVASTPAPPRRRKRKLREDEMRVKLTKYEELLKGYGKKLDDGDDAGSVDENGNDLTKLPKVPRLVSLTPSAADIVTPPPQRIEHGQMISENGMSKFLDK
jgi:hypothetical protein